MDIESVIALAKRLNISMEEMKEMNFISLMNILISSIDTDDEDNTATQSDIDMMFG